MQATHSCVWKVSITAKPTESDPHHPHADDAQASLRSELLGQLQASQSVIEAALADFAGADPTVREQLRSQLSSIAGLQQQVGTASIATLGKLQGQVSAIATVAASTAHEAQASAQSSSSSSMGMAQFASAARTNTNAVMAGMKDFDPYLQFGPGDTEAEYRQREAERRAYIAAQQAKNSPEGDLNASGAAIGQMVDAKAHGAGNSPEFKSRWDALISSSEKLRAEIISKGGSAKEFDDHLREDLRRILKVKGLSDAQIDAQFAAHGDNPIETAKAIVTEGDVALSGKDLAQIEISENQSGRRGLFAKQPTAVSSPDAPAPVSSSLTDAVGILKAAGVTSDQPIVTGRPTHGVNTQVAVASTSIRSV